MVDNENSASRYAALNNNCSYFLWLIILQTYIEAVITVGYWQGELLSIIHPKVWIWPKRWIDAMVHWLVESWVSLKYKQSRQFYQANNAINKHEISKLLHFTVSGCNKETTRNTPITATSNLKSFMTYS